MTFCPSCGGHGFCLGDCPQTDPHTRYWQRQAWTATVMLTQVTQPESRAYYSEQLRTAEAMLDDTVALPLAA